MENAGEAYFPMFVNLSEKKILIFGGGTISLRRTKTLLEFGAVVTVISTGFLEEFYRLFEQGRICLVQKAFEVTDIQEEDMVLAATDDDAVNDDIYRICKRKHIIVNTASDKSKCDFFFPAVIKKDHVVIGVTASGRDHKQAARTASEIRNFIKRG